jgi:hypothetical protein
VISERQAETSAIKVRAMTQVSCKRKFCNLSIEQIRISDVLLRDMTESTRKVTRNRQEGQSLPQTFILFFSEIPSLMIDEATLKPPGVPECKKQLYRNIQNSIC